MIWALAFGGIALAGLVMLICFAVWLWRKAVDLLREVSVLMERADELIGLLDQIEHPSDGARASDGRGRADEVGLTSRQGT